VFDVVREKGKGAGDINAKYSRELATLTAASWRAAGGLIVARLFDLPGVWCRFVRY
jgi:hypothetical protein